jgi:Ca2+-binding EF-hand superfamily protein
MKFINLLLGSIIVLSGMSIQAQEIFSEWDEDGDNLLEKEEFTDKFRTEFYSAWAKKSDTRGIIEEGFFEQSYAGLDTDNDNLISDEEWLIGYNYFYDDYLVNEEIGFIDTNNNNKLEYQEYYDVIYNTNYFTDVDLDSDNYISEYELSEYVFNNWDFDNNGVISRYEFNSFKLYYLDV